MSENRVSETIRAWLVLSRPPFHTVGVLPFILGGLLAWRLERVFRWDIFAWGAVGVILVMLATYFGGEYWDYVEDSFSSELGPSRFAGGSQVLQRGLLPRHAALWASLISLFSAICVVLVLHLGYRTGPLTITFGVMGVLGGFFYSTRPLRWVARGLGELWIVLCYGWLPVATGYYLQVGELTPIIHWIAAPIGLTIFNVILLNEFPDYQADLAAGKTNMIVRLGQERASIIYCLASMGSVVAMLFSLGRGVPLRALWLYSPVAIISLILVVSLLRGHWKDRALLERLCASTLMVNLGTTASYIFAFVG